MDGCTWAIAIPSCSVRVYVCVYIRTYVCVYIHMCVCTYVHMCVCTYVSVHWWIDLDECPLSCAAMGDSPWPSMWYSLDEGIPLWRTSRCNSSWQQSQSINSNWLQDILATCIGLRQLWTKLYARTHVCMYISKYFCSVSVCTYTPCSGEGLHELFVNLLV